MSVSMMSIMYRQKIVFSFVHIDGRFSNIHIYVITK